MKANKNGGIQFANINEIYGIIDSILTKQCFDEPMCELVCDLFTLANAGKTDGKKSLCLNLGTQTKAQQILLAFYFVYVHFYKLKNKIRDCSKYSFFHEPTRKLRFHQLILNI